jgi:hypothetical protein
MSLYETSDQGKAIYLKNVLFLMKLAEGDFTSDKLTATGKEDDGEDTVAAALSSLSKSFEHFVET